MIVMFFFLDTNIVSNIAYGGASDTVKELVDRKLDEGKVFLTDSVIAELLRHHPFCELRNGKRDLATKFDAYRRVNIQAIKERGCDVDSISEDLKETIRYRVQREELANDVLMYTEAFVAAQYEFNNPEFNNSKFILLTNDMKFLDEFWLEELKPEHLRSAVVRHILHASKESIKPGKTFEMKEVDIADPDCFR